MIKNLKIIAEFIGLMVIVFATAVTPSRAQFETTTIFNNNNTTEEREIEKCNLGMIDSCEMLIHNYMVLSVGSEKFSELLFQYSKIGCEKGTPLGCTWAASIYKENIDAFKELDVVDPMGEAFKLLERGCKLEQADPGLNCYELSIDYFSGSYEGISLNQAYDYGITACKIGIFQNCYALFHAYDKIKVLPNAPSKLSLLIKGLAGDLAFRSDWYDVPPPPPSWED